MSDKQQFTHPQGFKDVLPDDHIYNTFIKKVVRHRCRQSGYRRLTTPIFESAELLKNGVATGEKVTKLLRANSYAYFQFDLTP